jgi:hypothetical protein
LNDRKRLMTQPSWESVYQQHPIIVGGGQLPIDKLKVLPVFDHSKVTHTIRYWDKAGTDAADNEDAAYTAGARVHAMIDGTYVLSHMVRGQWAALERETKIKTWAEADEAMFPGHEIYCEQEPGSGGKESAAVTDFIAYVAGKAPGKKTIFGSYSDELGVRTNSDLQRILMSDSFKRMFPDTRISEDNYAASGRWKRNSSLIEYVNHEGSFRNTTVDGQINGMELHLGVIDDPLKGRAEAHSPTRRNKAWDWFADDFFGRFAKDGALLIVMTRWHVDDILGRYMQKFPEVRVLRYPAVAEHDELHRRKGEALFPEHKPLDFLFERKKLLTQPSWESQYQQHWHTSLEPKKFYSD